MFKVECKYSGRIYKVYAVSETSAHRPMFLIYDGEQFSWNLTSPYKPYKGE